MSGVPVPEATTHVMSLLFSSSYEVVLSVQLALHLAFAGFSFGTGHNGFFPFSSETLE